MQIVLVYANKGDNAKRFNAQKYYLIKGIIDNHNVINICYYNYNIINGKNFYDQAIDSDIKPYKEIRKLTTGQGEEYTIGCLLDYEYMKNIYRLIAVDLSWQKELDADPKAIQQIEFVGQLKKLDDDDGVESMFVLTILEKNKETRLRKCNSIIKYCKLSRNES